MGYSVRVSGLVLSGLLGMGAVVGQSDMAIGQPVEEKQTDDQQISEAAQLMRQGNQQSNRSQYDAALQSYEQALNIFRKVKYGSWEAITLHNLGETYRSLSQYDKAIIFHQQALKIFQQVNDRNGEAEALRGLGNVYLWGAIAI
jgi:tetratricopeptide (TPR) repeat protein